MDPSTALSESRLHVFVDFSNFYITLLSMCRPDAKPGTALWRVLFSNLMRVITIGRLPDSRVFVGSIPPAHEEIWNWARDAGFQVCLFPRAQVHEDKPFGEHPMKFGPPHGQPFPAPFRPKLKEVGVDNTLHAQMLQQIADRISNPDSAERTIVLVTGDANENKGAIKDYFMRPTSFPLCVQLALQNGWSVRLYAWRSSCSGYWKEMAEKKTPRFTLIYFDDFINVLGVASYLPPLPTPAPAPTLVPAPASAPPSVPAAPSAVPLAVAAAPVASTAVPPSALRCHVNSHHAQ